jgi:hypothetical protein
VKAGFRDKDTHTRQKLLEKRGFEILTAVVMKSTIFSNIAPAVKDRSLPLSKKRPHFSNTYMPRRKKNLVKSLDET